MQVPASIPDASIREAIISALAADDRTARAGLRVGVLNSIAHLAGKMDSQTGRDSAEELAGRVHGVRGVVNRIEAPGAPSPAREINLVFSGGHQPLEEQKVPTHDKMDE